MIKIAITGNIASGKSQVENVISSLGYKVIDTDKITHLLFEVNEVKQELKEAFGSQIFDNSGKILRDNLGKIVFTSTEYKKKLENIMHTKILEKMTEFFNNNKNEKVVFASVPLLFEVSWQNYFDKIIFVSADEKIRIKRLIIRNNFDIEYAKKRIASQLSEEEKIKKSDFVIYNNTDLNNLRKSVIKVIELINNKGNVIDNKPCP